MKRVTLFLNVFFAAFVVAQPATKPAGPEGIDVPRVRKLQERQQNGETLSPEDQAYLERARQIIRARAGGAPSAGGPGAGRIPASQRSQAGATTGQLRTDVDLSLLVPLTEMTAPYKGEDGGLYGGGKNTPPDEHFAAYLKESAQIQPLDPAGHPAQGGKIGFITIGFSNTNLESTEFCKTATDDPQKSPSVIMINGAIGLRSAVMWAWDGADVLPKPEQDRLDKEMDQVGMPKDNRRVPPGMPAKDTWPQLEARLKAAGVSPAQVQVVWMKHVEANPRPLGDFPAHAKALQQDMADILIIARHKYPNLRIAYLSSRTFSGWNAARSGSPEPYAYESGFGTRWLIQDQIKGNINGNTDLNYDPAKGDVKAPLMIWGPYIWANGPTPRKSDGMTWDLIDVRADDHLHPSEVGVKKIAAMLMNYLKTDKGSKRWFLTPQAAESPKLYEVKNGQSAPAAK